MASEELKPCPFCGGTKVEPRHDDGIFWHKCKACGATGPTLSRYSGEEGEPYNDWNRRAQDFDAMRQRVELLEGLLTEVRQRCPLPDWARSRIDTALSTWRQAHTPSTLPASSAEELSCLKNMS